MPVFGCSGFCRIGCPRVLASSSAVAYQYQRPFPRATEHATARSWYHCLAVLLAPSGASARSAPLAYKSSTIISLGRRGRRTAHGGQGEPTGWILEDGFLLEGVGGRRVMARWPRRAPRNAEEDGISAILQLPRSICGRTGGCELVALELPLGFKL